MRPYILGFTLSITTFVRGQDIHFAPTPEQARENYAAQGLVMHCADSLISDTLMIEDAAGRQDTVVQTYPLARYEFHPDGALFRRIDIVQSDDTREVGSRVDPGTGDTIGMVEVVIVDIPTGNYHEFFPNGSIRIMGRLAGYNADGTLRKVGEWREWDTTGTVIRKEQYP